MPRVIARAGTPCTRPTPSVSCSLRFARQTLNGLGTGNKQIRAAVRRNKLAVGISPLIAAAKDTRSTNLDCSGLSASASSGQRGDLASREALLAEQSDLASQLASRLHGVRLVASAARQALATDRSQQEPIIADHQVETLVGPPADADSPPSTFPSRGGSQRVAEVGDRVAAEQRLGRFVLVRCLGAGGFGSVWSARDTQPGRQVAIKIPYRRRFLSIPGTADTTSSTAV
jgi:hypothetical protein